MEETHHPFFCCSKWYLSSFLNQSSNVEIFMFGKYQNYSCQHFFFFHFGLFACFSQHHLMNSVAFKNSSDQPNMIYSYRRRKETRKMQFRSSCRHFTGIVHVEQVKEHHRDNEMSCPFHVTYSQF